MKKDIKNGGTGLPLGEDSLGGGFGVSPVQGRFKGNGVSGAVSKESIAQAKVKGLVEKVDL